MNRITNEELTDKQVNLKSDANLLDAVDKLWLYENTGLDPDEVKDLSDTFKMILRSIQLVFKTMK